MRSFAHSSTTHALPLLLALATLVAACGSSTEATPTNALPVLSSVTPSLLIVGSASATLRLSGSAFVPGSHVIWNGAERIPRYTNSSTLDLDLTSTDLAASVIVPVAVRNPPPGGGSSGLLTITIGGPPPTIATVTPSSFALGPLSVFLTITGTGFTSRSLVFWDAETAGFVPAQISPTRLFVQIPGFEFPTARTYTLRVYDPNLGSGYSSRVDIVVTPKP